MRRMLLLVGWIMTVSAWGSAVEGGGGIVYGTDYAFSLRAPPGWVIDNKAGFDQGTNAVFYPQGGSWESSPVVCYANARTITAQEKTPEQMARADIADFRANGSPNYTGRFTETMKLPDSQSAQVWRFEGDSYGNFEAIAYIVEKKTINFIVVSARSRDGLQKAWPSFLALVLSYRYMGDHVSVEPAKLGPGK